MTRKHSDDTIFVKRGGKYIPAGKWFDRDSLGFGDWFVNNTKYRKGFNSISASPNPDYIGLETAVEECREELRMLFKKIIESDKRHEWMANHNAADEVIQVIRKTFLVKKQQMLDYIKQ